MVWNYETNTLFAISSAAVCGIKAFGSKKTIYADLLESKRKHFSMFGKNNYVKI